MFAREPRRFRYRSNGRKHTSHGSGHAENRLRSNVFSNGQTRNNFRTPLSAEKLFEKYSSLAKEAMSSGDKTLYENYLQHADHFMRMIEDKNRNRNQNKVNVINKPVEDSNKPVEDSKSLSNNDVTLEQNKTKNKD